MSEAAAKLEVIKRVAVYARARHALYDFDAWDFVSWLWLKYAQAGALPSATYLRLAVLSYAYRERKKRNRCAELDGQTLTGPVADDERRTSLEDVATVEPSSHAEARSRRFEVARMLASGMTHAQISAALGVARSTVSQTVGLMFRKKRAKQGAIR